MVESASSLPWLWVIQAVASCEGIDISILQDLVRASAVPQDDFCEKTRELIALRCLEEIFDCAHSVGCDAAASASLDSRIRFDFSSSCEDVLQKILDEMDGTKLLKGDVFPFIMHKRATIKCDLQQLKESICEGTHPYADHLRDICGLLHQNENSVHVNDNYCESMEAKENSMSGF